MKGVASGPQLVWAEGGRGGLTEPVTGSGKQGQRRRSYWREKGGGGGVGGGGVCSYLRGGSRSNLLSRVNLGTRLRGLFLGQRGDIGGNFCGLGELQGSNHSAKGKKPRDRRLA